MRRAPVRGRMLTGAALLFGQLGLILPVVLPLQPAAAAVRNVDYDLKEIEQAKGLGGNLQAAKTAAREDAVRQAAEMLMQTDGEREAFRRHPELLGDPTFIRSAEMTDKFQQSGQTGVVLKAVVEYRRLRDAMEAKGIIQSVSAVASDIGSPRTLVWFDVGEGQQETLETQWVIDRANNYLGAHGADLVLREEIDRLMRSDAAIAQAKGGLGALATSAGADIYIKARGAFENTRRSGDWQFALARIQLQAVDCGTGRILAERAGESRELALKGNVDTSRKAAIEEAVGGVMAALFSDLLKGWKQAVGTGRTYRIVLNGAGDRERVAVVLKNQGATAIPQGSGFAVTYKGSLSTLRKALRSEAGLKLVRSDASLLEMAF